METSGSTAKSMQPLHSAHGGHHVQQRPTLERLAPGKPMSVVHFVKPARYRADRGESLRISLTLLASEPVTSVWVEANAEEGVLLLSSRDRSIDSLETGREVQLEFDILAQLEGRRYVNVVVSADTPSGRRMSAYSVPIEVGNLNKAAGRKTDAGIVEDDQGNRLILMQAEAPQAGPLYR